MPSPDLALIVPCHNEADRLQPQAFLDFVASRPGVRLLFVDDGSTDATADVLERLRSAAPDSTGILQLPSRQGKGEAVRRGVGIGGHGQRAFVNRRDGFETLYQRIVVQERTLRLWGRSGWR